MLMIDGVEMVDVQEAAKLVRRTPETIRRWVWSGRVAATKRGNKLLIKRADVLAASGDRAAREAALLSLPQWAAAVARVNPCGRGGRSASDLVLEDRAERDTPSRRGAHAGR